LALFYSEQILMVVFWFFRIATWLPEPKPDSLPAKTISVGWAMTLHGLSCLRKDLRINLVNPEVEATIDRSACLPLSKRQNK